MRTHLLVSLLTLSASACVADLETDDSETSTIESDPATTTDPAGSGGPTDPPEPVGLSITRVEWRWSGCGSDPSLSAIGTRLTVDVFVNSGTPTLTESYTIKGQAVGCEPFDGNGQAKLCASAPAAVVRMLSVAVTSTTLTGGSDSRDIALADCVDGKSL